MNEQWQRAIWANLSEMETMYPVALHVTYIKHTPVSCRTSIPAMKLPHIASPKRIMAGLSVGLRRFPCIWLLGYVTAAVCLWCGCRIVEGSKLYQTMVVLPRCRGTPTQHIETRRSDTRGAQEKPAISGLWRTIDFC